MHPSNLWTRAPLSLLLWLILLLPSLQGCGKRGHEAPQGGANIPPSKVRLKRTVDLTPVVQRKMTSYVDTVGVLEAESQVDIAAGVSGVVDELFVREGTWVFKDQTLLARIESRRYQALAAQAEASYHKAESNVRRAESMVKKAQAAIRDAEQALELRKIVLENIRRAGRAIKVEERQEAQTTLDAAQARLEVARADLAVSIADVESARKEADAARALRDIAEHNLRRSQVRAPFTGQINQIRVRPGNFVEDKSVIATMADLSRLRLVGYIPEKFAPIVREMVQHEELMRTAFLLGNAYAGALAGLAAVHVEAAGETPSTYKIDFTIRPFPDKVFQGRIFYLSTVANSDTHQFECKAEVSRYGIGQLLRPGFSAKIRCPLPGRPYSLAIPEESVRASERGFIAFRPRQITSKSGEVEYVAEAVPLELGQREPGWVEVLKGLQAGDWVVRKGAEALEENTPLAVPPEQAKALQHAVESPLRRE